jgi:hypothetical protein
MHFVAVELKPECDRLPGMVSFPSPFELCDLRFPAVKAFLRIASASRLAFAVTAHAVAGCDRAKDAAEALLVPWPARGESSSVSVPIPT